MQAWPCVDLSATRSTNWILSSFSHIKKWANSAPNRICPSQAPFSLCLHKERTERANNQPFCQLATLKASPFPRYNVIMNTSGSPPLAHFEIPTAANEEKKGSACLHLSQLTTYKETADRVAIATFLLILYPFLHVNQWVDRQRWGEWSGEDTPAPCSLDELDLKLEEQV